MDFKITCYKDESYGIIRYKKKDGTPCYTVVDCDDLLKIINSSNLKCDDYYNTDGLIRENHGYAMTNFGMSFNCFLHNIITNTNYHETSSETHHYPANVEHINGILTDNRKINLKVIDETQQTSYKL